MGCLAFWMYMSRVLGFVACAHDSWIFIGEMLAAL